MKLISPALLIEALAVRYPDSSKLFAPDVFADFVVEYAKDSAFDVATADVLRPLVESSDTQPGPAQAFYDLTQRPIRTEYVNVDDKGNLTFCGITRGPRMRIPGPSSNLPKPVKKARHMDPRACPFAFEVGGPHNWRPGNGVETCTHCGRVKLT